MSAATMNMDHIIYTVCLVLVVGLPIIFRKKYAVRLFCVLLVLGAAIALIHSGLRLAARNTDRPAMDIFRSDAVYGEAWLDGAKATQKQVDAYFFPLAIHFFILALLAIIPQYPIVDNRKKHKS